MARTAVGYFRDRVSADTAADELLQRGFGRGDISVVERGRKQAETRDAPLTAGEGAAVAGGTSVRQSVGASPGAPGFPDPRPMVGDDPGLIDTPAVTPTGTTGDIEPPDPTLDPDRATHTPTHAPASRGPTQRRSGGPPII
jgi:hypothetical protein